jgi:hypothetical protein
MPLRLSLQPLPQKSAFTFTDGHIAERLAAGTVIRKNRYLETGRNRIFSARQFS